jgi:hypothetical protein
MPITYKPLSEEDHKSLHELSQSVYLDGECYAFAIALHRLLGWDLIGIMEGEVVRHACVVHCGRYYDVRGQVPKNKLGAPFGLSSPELRPITEETLYATRPIGDSSIAQSEWIAEALWPELPWRSGPMVKYRSFLIELAALCEKHGTYIFAPYPMAKPLLTEAVGDEKGFMFSPTSNGRLYFFDRVL